MATRCSWAVIGEFEAISLRKRLSLLSEQEGGSSFCFVRAGGGLRSCTVVRVGLVLLMGILGGELIISSR